MNIYQSPSAKTVRGLLRAAGLPTDDIGGELEHFIGCGAPDDPTGVVGLELFGEVAMLRSLVVVPSARGTGCGAALVSAAEDHARRAGMRRVFLLTETAREFFERRGYRPVSRDEAPESIRGTTEFSALCPESASFMVKGLD